MPASVGGFYLVNLTVYSDPPPSLGAAIWNLVIATTAAINVDRFGRRPLFLTSVVGMLLLFSTIMGLSAGYAISKNTAIGIAVVPFLFM